MLFDSGHHHAPFLGVKSYQAGQPGLNRNDLQQPGLGPPWDGNSDGGKFGEDVDLCSGKHLQTRWGKAREDTVSQYEPETNPTAR